MLVYVHKNKNFRIPEDDATPIINKLPNHPLETERYVTMGDWHSTRKPKIGDGAESTRYNGEEYKCGLHEASGENDFQINTNLIPS